MGGWFEQECLLRQAKHGSNVYPKVQGNLPGSSSDRGMYLKCTKRLEVQKYLRKSYCHRIECCLGLPTSQMAREGVRWEKHSSSDLDDQQVQDQDFSKETIQHEKPSMKRGSKKKKENTVAIRNQTCNRTSRAIYRNQSPLTLPRIFFFSVNLLSFLLCHQDLFTCCLIH